MKSRSKKKHSLEEDLEVQQKALKKIIRALEGQVSPEKKPSKTHKK